MYIFSFLLDKLGEFPHPPKSMVITIPHSADNNTHFEKLKKSEHAHGIEQHVLPRTSHVMSNTGMTFVAPTTRTVHC